MTTQETLWSAVSKATVRLLDETHPQLTVKAHAVSVTKQLAQRMLESRIIRKVVIRSGHVALVAGPGFGGVIFSIYSNADGYDCRLLTEHVCRVLGMEVVHDDDLAIGTMTSADATRIAGVSA